MLCSSSKAPLRTYRQPGQQSEARGENQNRTSGRIVRFWHSDYFFSWRICHWGILGPGKDDGGFAGKWHCNLPSAEVMLLSWARRGQERGYDDQAKVESLERLLEWIWPIMLANATRPVDRLEFLLCRPSHSPSLEHGTNGR